MLAVVKTRRGDFRESPMRRHNHDGVDVGRFGCGFEIRFRTRVKAKGPADFDSAVPFMIDRKNH